MITVTFSLWAYSKTVNDNYSMDGFVAKEVEKVVIRQFITGEADQGSPDVLFIFDAAFFFARTFAIATTAIGFVAMLALWLSSAKVQQLNTDKTRKIIGTGLLTCCLFQFFVLLIFLSKVCRDTEYGEDRHCSLEEGSGTIFGGCLFWLLTGIAMIKMSPPGDSDDESDDNAVSEDSADLPTQRLQVHDTEPV